VTARRRRALTLIALAVACGGLASSRVSSREAHVEEQVGKPVRVLVARGDIPAGRRITEEMLAVRPVPARFVPPDALADPADARSLRAAVPLERGAYVTASSLTERAAPVAAGSPLRTGERAVEISVAGSDALAGAGPGARVDVLVTSEPRSGAGRTWVALEDVELLALRSGGEPADTSKGIPTSLATLRVTLRQAVFLTAAQSFARELRLLPRPPGERRRGLRIEASL
jgi:pilus assembly protein CpaB